MWLHTKRDHKSPIINTSTNLFLYFKSLYSKFLQWLFHNFSLVSAFSQRNKTYKMGLRVCVCVQFWSPPHNNFQTYPIDTKFWLQIVSYRNSPTPLIPFLSFENSALEKFFKLIFSPFNINMGKFSNSYYASDIRLRWLKFSM